jgi:membrane associated rhomboid family serine protease
MKEKAKFLDSLFYPLLFLIIIWGIKIAENAFSLSLGKLGIYPLQVRALPGIIFAPLVHGSYYHLFANSGPLLVLGTAIFYFYRQVAFRLIILAWLMTGLWVWFGGRPAYHIGASGLVYAFASFLFFSGFIRKSIELIAISFVIVFLYGGMFWEFSRSGEISPGNHISWEALQDSCWLTITRMRDRKGSGSTGSLKMTMRRNKYENIGLLLPDTRHSRKLRHERDQRGIPP